MWKKALSFIVIFSVWCGVVRADTGVLATNNTFTGTSVKCDGTTDDQSAFQTLINDLQAQASSVTGADYKNRSYITFPPNTTCKFNSGWTFNAEKVGIAGDGTLFDFSGMSTSGTVNSNVSAGTGNGTNTNFSIPAGIPILAGTTTYTAGAVTGSDTGQTGSVNTGQTPITGTGVVSGPNSQVSLFYANSGIQFAVAPSNGTPVTVTYTTYLPAITATTSGNGYGARATVLRGIHLLGPGSSTPTIGVLSEGNNLTWDQLTVHDFGADVVNGSNGYTNVFITPNFYDAYIDYDVTAIPGGGENLFISGGTMFNSTHAIYTAGEVATTGTSYDFFSQTPFIAFGQLRANNVHIEGNGISNGPLFTANGCNAFGYIMVNNSQIQVDNSPSSTEALVENDGFNNPQAGYSGCNGNGHGAWVQMAHNFINGLNASGLNCFRGSNGQDCVIGTSVDTTVAGSAPLWYNVVSLQDNTTGSGGGDANNLPNVGF